MIDGTINDGKTIAGGGKVVVLAGRYHIIRQFAARNTRFAAHLCQIAKYCIMGNVFPG